MNGQEKMLEINARKTPDPLTGYNRYTWEDVRELAEADGYCTGWCRVCGDLCIGQPGTDPVLEGYAQRDQARHQGQCLDVIYGLEM